MGRWFDFSLGWSMGGAAIGVALGFTICWSLGAHWPYWLGVSLVLAIFCGLMASFFGDKTIELILEVLSFFF